MSILEGEVTGMRERMSSMSEPEMVLGLLPAFFLVPQADGVDLVVVRFLLITPLDLTVTLGSTVPSPCLVSCGVAGPSTMLDGGI